MTWEHRNWYSFVWICGDQIVEQHLHNIDVCNWVMGDASGGSGGVRRRGLAAARGRDLRQHLRSHQRRFHVSERRPHVQLLPPVSRTARRRMSAR